MGANQLADPAGHSFDSRIVVNAIRRRLRDVQACYENLLRRDYQLSGLVRVQFEILEDGSFSDVHSTENTTDNSSLAACVVDVVGTLHAEPAPVGGSVRFGYPFVFAPQS